MSKEICVHCCEEFEYIDESLSCDDCIDEAIEALTQSLEETIEETDEHLSMLKRRKEKLS